MWNHSQVPNYLSLMFSILEFCCCWLVISTSFDAVIVIMLISIFIQFLTCSFCIIFRYIYGFLGCHLTEIIPFFFLQASVAKLETSVSFFSDKLELKIYGFNDKLPVLLSKVLAVAKSFLPTEERFKVNALLSSICVLFFSSYSMCCCLWSFS